MTKREVMQNWFDRVWTQEDSSFIHEGFAPEPENPNSATGLGKHAGLNPDDFVNFHRAVLNLAGDMRISIDSAFENEDWISMQCTARATSRATGQPVEMRGACISKIKGDKIQVSHNYFDFLHFFEGLGLLPEETFARCLSGEPVPE